MKVMVIEKQKNIWLTDELAYRPVHTYNNVLCYDSFANDEGRFNRLWLEDGKTATFNSADYAFVILS